MSASHKYKNLDGLRGVAALVVVLCHYIAAFAPSADGSPAIRHFRGEHLIGSTPLHLPFAGNFAVCVFFVLSGFVLSNKFFRTKDQSVLVSSAVRRYFRLMLPAFVSVILAFVILRAGFAFNAAAADSTGSLWLDSFWKFPPVWHSALWEGFYGAFFGTSVSYNPTLWTMRYELYGSFMIFMFLSLFGKLDKRWVFYAIFCLVFLHSYYLAFMLGVILSDICVQKPQLIDRLHDHIGYAFLATGLVLGGWFTPVLYSSIYTRYALPLLTAAQWEQLAHTLGATFLIIAVLKLHVVSRILELRPVQYLGKVSFSLYLVHFILLGSLASFVFTKLIPLAGYSLSVAAAGIITITITFIAAHYYTRYVDNPAINTSRMIGDYLLSSTSKSRHTVKNREAAPQLLPLVPAFSPEPISTVNYREPSTN